MKEGGEAAHTSANNVWPRHGDFLGRNMHKKWRAMIPAVVLCVLCLRLQCTLCAVKTCGMAQLQCAPWDEPLMELPSCGWRAGLRGGGRPILRQWDP
jgi:hypothetical protein